MSAPSTREVLDRVLADERGELHTSFPARVIAYDVEAQTVDVRPGLLREVPSDDPAQPWGYDQLPDILSVQIMWPRAGGFVITFPIQVGDWVLVLAAEQCTLLWRAKGDAPSHPGLNDPHGLNGCVALPGWFPDVQKLGNVSASDLVIGKTDATSTIAIKPDGTIVLGDVSATKVALAELVADAFDGLKQAISSAAVTAAPDGGLSFKTGLLAALNTASWPPSVAASKVKAT